MKAIMLAAGVGRRLFGDDREQPPKALIELGGKTLMQRHVENLLDLGVDELVMVVGYRRQLITEAATSAGPDGFVRTMHNSRFRGGPVLSLWTARELLFGGDDVLVDEGRVDVTYEVAMRDVMVSEPVGTFGVEDISGIPWIEIDFPSDLLRAEQHILPRLSETFPESGAAWFSHSQGGDTAWPRNTGSASTSAAPR